MPKGLKTNTEDFIRMSQAIHGDKYDYSLVDYINNKEYVKIICKVHGEFLQSPRNHLKGYICKKCSLENTAKINRNRSLLNRFKNIIQPEKYKIIPLTRGRFTMVDNEDFENIKGINWHCTAAFYAKNNSFGLLHRLIMNCPDGLVVDHINHDTLDNRKHNLRVCKYVENSMNQKPPRKKSFSNFKGVNLHHGRWRANMKFQGKHIHIGNFDTEIEAAIAYNEKAKEIYGEFAFLNIL
ncbi:HNH endonuclease [Sphingobacterium multivorum]|uniref:HNH endonuclease n=1 Tax=Sphingobacterium multivorum TaxID=28454 RepID=UPI0036C589DD